MGRERPVPYAASFYAIAVTTALTGPEHKRAEARALIAEYGAELCADIRARSKHGQDEDGLSVGLGGLMRELLAERLGPNEGDPA